MKANVHEAKTQFSKLLARVAAGEEVIITKAGKPVARLLPVKGSEPRSLGMDRGAVTLADDFDAPLPPELMAEFES
jgi:prevent-host-death family protein